VSAYLKFFQLEKSPFDTRAQSNLVLGTKALRTAYTEIEDALVDGAPRICVDGKEGLGKTSLARALPKLLGETARVVLILNPSLPWSTLRSAIVKQLDLAEGNLSRKTLMRVRGEGRRLVIAVDQAERISSESLDHLDILLGYKNDDDEQLMHCVLLANLEAAASHHNEQGEQTPLLWWLDKLNTLQLEFQPIPAAGVGSYVQKHLKRAGWKGGQIFTPDALQTIHRLTGGVPREMSDLCEHALELAAEEQAERIDAGLIEDVFGEIPLEDVVDDRDITDSAFVGARDDDASSNTTTFSAEAVRVSQDREPAFGHGESDDPTAAPVRDESSSQRDQRDPRIDRMPTPGRSVHAPVDAPISLDSFFGDSLDGGPTTPAPEAPPEATTGPDAATSDAFLETYEQTETEQEQEQQTEQEAERFETPERGSGLVKWLGIAAGVLIVLGGGVWGALSLLGGEAPESPPVLARPKTASAAPAPIAGIEAVPSPSAGSTTPEEPAPGEDPSPEAANAPDIFAEARAIAAGNAKAADPAEPAPGRDPLLGFDAFPGDPLDPDIMVPTPGADATRLEGDGQAAAASAQATARAAGESAAPSTTADAALAPVPAAPAPEPTVQNPADAEVDAPFW